MATSWIQYLVFNLLVLSVEPAALQLTGGEYEHLRDTTDILLINFYADWCRFSQQIKPIFDESSDKLSTMQLGRSVALARVDCPVEGSLCRDVFHINKYPTLKIIKYGIIMRKEYRGKRAADDIVEFMKQLTEDNIKEIPQNSNLKEYVKEASVIGTFPSKDGLEYDVFRKISSVFDQGCAFLAEIRPDQPKKTIQFYAKEGSEAFPYTEELNLFDSLYLWVYTLCMPLVREITFQNGEELTEEGLPFLILFYAPGDEESKTLFETKIKREVSHERKRMNFVTADGKVFSHPLYHLGKTVKDLPLICIDSFQHMYVFPDFNDIHVPGKLQKFIDDLFSGKLHREFHYGPDKTDQPSETPNNEDSSSRSERSLPPESSFKKLKPGKSRYTFVRDEL